MASFSDRVAGLFFLLVATTVFTYYTLWVIVTPFLAPSSAIQAYFLPRYYAVAIPVVLLVVGLTGIGAFLGSVMLKNGKKKTA